MKSNTKDKNGNGHRALMDSSILQDQSRMLHECYAVDPTGFVSKQSMHARFLRWYSSPDQSGDKSLLPASTVQFFQHLPMAVASIFPDAYLSRPRTKAEKDGEPVTIFGAWSYLGIRAKTPEEVAQYLAEAKAALDALFAEPAKPWEDDGL